MELNFDMGKIIPIDKPMFWTSFDVVNKVRNMLKIKTGNKKIKVGHSGTLDPLATGLLLLFTGKATKQIRNYTDTPKTYEGVFMLGATTPSFDLETNIDRTYPTDHITTDLIYITAEKFIGIIEQIPPAFSAKKVDGQKAYNLARKGIVPTLKAKKVEIFSFNILSVNMPEISFSIKCSSGTYIRSIANDFGTALKSGAYLTKLRRTSIGDFILSDAYTIESFENLLFGHNQNKSLH